MTGCDLTFQSLAFYPLGSTLGFSATQGPGAVSVPSDNSFSPGACHAGFGGFLGQVPVNSLYDLVPITNDGTEFIVLSVRLLNPPSKHCHFCFQFNGFYAIEQAGSGGSYLPSPSPLPSFVPSFGGGIIMLEATGVLNLQGAIAVDGQDASASSNSFCTTLRFHESFRNIIS